MFVTFTIGSRSARVDVSQPAAALDSYARIINAAVSSPLDTVACYNHASRRMTVRPAAEVFNNLVEAAGLRAQADALIAAYRRVDAADAGNLPEFRSAVEAAMAVEAASDLAAIALAAAEMA